VLIREFESKVYTILLTVGCLLYSSESPCNLYKKGHVIVEGHIPSTKAAGDNMRAIVNVGLCIIIVIFIVTDATIYKGLLFTLLYGLNSLL